MLLSRDTDKQWNSLVDGQCSCLLGYLPESSPFHKRTIDTNFPYYQKKKIFFTWNDKIKLTAQGYWRFYSKLDKGLVLVLLQVADEDREIYDPGYYCKPLGPIFPHIHLVFRYIPW